VPGAYTSTGPLVIQHAMGWWDYHLHSFDIGGIQYGEPDPLTNCTCATASTLGSTPWSFLYTTLGDGGSTPQVRYSAG
jgi:hypothetical protein